MKRKKEKVGNYEYYTEFECKDCKKMNPLDKIDKDMKCDNCKAWEEYKENIHQGNQSAPVAFTGHEFENIEKEQIKYYVRKYRVKAILLFLLVVAGLVIYLVG